MAGKIKVLNIGAFKPINTWFLNDMKSFTHFFSLLPNSVVTSKHFIYKNLSPYDDPIGAKSISNNMKIEFLNEIDLFVKSFDSKEEIDLVCIIIHGHGSVDSNKQWQLNFASSKLESQEIFNSFKNLTMAFRTLIVLNSCSAVQDAQFIEPVKAKSQIDVLSKFMLPVIEANNPHPSYFGELEIRNEFQEKETENSMETFTTYDQKTSIEKGINKFNLDDNVTFYERESALNLYFVSLSRNLVERANSMLSYGGILINSLAIVDDKILVPELWHFIKSFLEILNPNYQPVLSIHSIDIQQAKETFSTFKIDFGFNYSSNVSNNMIINQAFFDSQLPK